MAIDKLIPRYLNNDDDFLVVKSVEMIDAINVHVGDNAEGNADVLKNSRGNALMAFAAGSELPVTGTNTVVGSGLNIEKSEIVFAVHNSLGNHSIYHYSTSSNVLRLVYRDSVLGFTATSFVKFDFIVKENGDTLAYFTDGVTDPKKINITKALLGTGYPYKVAGGYTYTDEEKLLCITNAKQPPLDPPTLAFTTIANQDNFIYDEYFQFAYQYVYEDGEVSALSPYSEIGVNTQQLLDGLISDSAKDLFNAINVTVKHSRSDVSKIRLLAKSAENLGFFAAGEINNSRSSSTATIAFTNSKLRSYISAIEQNKMYDNVPQKANAQAISGNRLMFGGYTEFYDNVPTNVGITEISNGTGNSAYISVNPTVAATVGYNPGASSFTSKFNVVVGDTLNTTSYNSQVILDFQLSGGLFIDPGLATDIDLSPTESTYSILFGKVDVNIFKQFVLPPYGNLTSGSPDVYSYFVNNISGNTQPTPISGVTASVGFFRTDDFTDNSFIILAQYVANEYGTPQTFSNGNDASVWLTTNGFWNSYPASTTLIMNLDSTIGVTGSTWTDSSTGGHNATLNGGYGTTTYNSNQVVTLNGTSGYVLPSSFGTQLSTGFTYNVWVYPTTFNNGTIIAEFGGTPPNGWKDAQIALVSENINGGVFNPTAFSPTGYITGPTFSPNTWYNIAMTYNSTTKDLKLYINGALN